MSHNTRELAPGASPAAGTTLLELLVALAVLGAALGVAGLAVRGLETSEEAEIVRALHAARSRAIVSGQPALYEARGDTVRFAPDGTAMGGPIVTDSVAALVDPVTGEVRLARR